MRSGSLKHKVLIEKSTSTPNGYGEVTQNWSLHVETFASIEPLRGQELFTSQQTYNKVISRHSYEIP